MNAHVHDGLNFVVPVVFKLESLGAQMLIPCCFGFNLAVVLELRGGARVQPRGGDQASTPCGGAEMLCGFTTGCRHTPCLVVVCMHCSIYCNPDYHL